MRIVFAGTPDIAATVLAKLLTTEHTIVGVFSQPDRPSGRGRKLTASPVKTLALQHNIATYQPLKMDDDAHSQLHALNPDLMIVVAYGIILPQTILDIPHLGCWNVHVSLLPRWRGAAPIQRAIEAGDKTTGVTLMQMDAGLDTGPILLQRQCVIGTEDTSNSLHDTLAELGANTVIEGLALQHANQLTATPQPAHNISYARKLTKAESSIDWNTPAIDINNKIRAFTPWPGCNAQINNTVIKIVTATALNQERKTHNPGTIIAIDSEGITVQTLSGTIIITAMQFPGGKPLKTKQILNGRPDFFKTGYHFDPIDKSKYK